MNWHKGAGCRSELSHAAWHRTPTRCPDFVKESLAAEGFDVSGFRPPRVTDDDIVASDRVIDVSTTLPVGATSVDAKVEQWDDVPAASTDYAQSRVSIKAHVVDLLERLAHP